MVVVIMPMHGGVLAACGLLICHPDHCMNPRNKNKKKVMLVGRCVHPASSLWQSGWRVPEELEETSPCL